MRPPAFWQNPPTAPGWQAVALAPVAAIFGAATARRVARPPGFRSTVPVICVGNLNVGGSGKTPTVIALAMRIKARGLDAHIVSRGYGGQMAGPVRVTEGTHSAKDVGDEPLLLAAFAPTWVARDRAAGVLAAQGAGADLILLDDGFQNPSVQKDFSIVVVDAGLGFGNGRVLPAGPLREPVAVGLARADLVLSIGTETDQSKFSSNWLTGRCIGHVTGQLVPLETGMTWRDLKVLAFAGIGHPEKFFDTLRRLGANVIRAEPLQDHQPLGSSLMKRLAHEATALDAQLVTTEKDAVRLPREFRQQVLTLPVRLQVQDWSAIDASLAKLGLGKSGSGT